MKKPILTTSKMPEETEQQYTAWLLYCEAGSVPRLIRLWEQVRYGVGETTGIWGEKINKFGPLPTQRSVEKWSSKYRWVERMDLKLTEDVEALREKTKKIANNKMHRIAETFERVITKVLKRLRENEEPSIDDLKKVWEMLRTELGETLGKHTHAIGIDESTQTPPNEEEKALGRLLNNTAKQFYVQRGREKQQSKYSHLDRKPANKNRER